MRPKKFPRPKIRANRAANDAAQAQLALEKFKAPRQLAEGSRLKLLETLRPFSGLHIFLKTNPIDAEAVSLAIQLQRLFEEAGWYVHIWSTPDPSVDLASGILVEEVTGADDRYKEVAQTIRNALIQEGIQVPHEVMMTEIGNPTAWIRLTIGRKPIANLRAYGYPVDRRSSTARRVAGTGTYRAPRSHLTAGQPRRLGGLSLCSQIGGR
jgi:hypothetical protein